jgi:hypothetical protein
MPAGCHALYYLHLIRGTHTPKATLRSECVSVRLQVQDPIHFLSLIITINLY